MLLDYPASVPGQTLKPRRDIRARLTLRSALSDLAKGQGEFQSHSERSWASATFAGTRHQIGMAFAGDRQIAAGEDFIARLPDHEFSISGHLVADATVTGVEHTLGGEPTLKVDIEVLLLDES